MGAIYEIGALCALDESLDGIDFSRLDHYVGVSAGGFIAAGLANGVKAFSALIDAPNSDDAVLDYYLMAENAGAAVFFPATYSFKPNMVILSELNK